jgi:hypothetical protein
MIRPGTPKRQLKSVMFVYVLQRIYTNTNVSSCLSFASHVYVIKKVCYIYQRIGFLDDWSSGVILISINRMSFEHTTTSSSSASSPPSGIVANIFDLRAERKEQYNRAKLRQNALALTTISQTNGITALNIQTDITLADVVLNDKVIAILRSLTDVDLATDIHDEDVSESDFEKSFNIEEDILSPVKREQWKLWWISQSYPIKEFGLKQLIRVFWQKLRYRITRNIFFVVMQLSLYYCSLLKFKKTWNDLLSSFQVDEKQVLALAYGPLQYMLYRQFMGQIPAYASDAAYASGYKYYSQLRFLRKNPEISMAFAKKEIVLAKLHKYFSLTNEELVSLAPINENDDVSEEWLRKNVQLCRQLELRLPVEWRREGRNQEIVLSKVVRNEIGDVKAAIEVSAFVPNYRLGIYPTTQRQIGILCLAELERFKGSEVRGIQVLRSPLEQVDSAYGAGYIHTTYDMKSQLAVDAPLFAPEKLERISFETIAHYYISEDEVKRQRAINRKYVTHAPLTWIDGVAIYDGLIKDLLERTGIGIASQQKAIGTKLRDYLLFTVLRDFEIIETILVCPVLPRLDPAYGLVTSSKGKEPENDLPSISVCTSLFQSRIRAKTLPRLANDLITVPNIQVVLTKMQEAMIRIRTGITNQSIPITRVNDNQAIFNELDKVENQSKQQTVGEYVNKISELEKTLPDDLIQIRHMYRTDLPLDQLTRPEATIVSRMLEDMSLLRKRNQSAQLTSMVNCLQMFITYVEQVLDDNPNGKDDRETSLLANFNFESNVPVQTLLEYINEMNVASDRETALVLEEGRRADEIRLHMKAIEGIRANLALARIPNPMSIIDPKEAVAYQNKIKSLTTALESMEARMDNLRTTNDISPTKEELRKMSPESAKRVKSVLGYRPQEISAKVNLYAYTYIEEMQVKMMFKSASDIVNFFRDLTIKQTEYVKMMEKAYDIYTRNKEVLSRLQTKREQFSGTRERFVQANMKIKEISLSLMKEARIIDVALHQTKQKSAILKAAIDVVETHGVELAPPEPGQKLYQPIVSEEEYLSERQRIETMGVLDEKTRNEIEILDQKLKEINNLDQTSVTTAINASKELYERAQAFIMKSGIDALRKELRQKVETDSVLLGRIDESNRMSEELSELNVEMVKLQSELKSVTKMIPSLEQKTVRLVDEQTRFAISSDNFAITERDSGNANICYFLSRNGYQDLKLRRYALYFSQSLDIKYEGRLALAPTRTEFGTGKKVYTTQYAEEKVQELKTLPELLNIIDFKMIPNELNTIFYILHAIMLPRIARGVTLLDDLGQSAFRQKFYEILENDSRGNNYIVYRGYYGYDFYWRKINEEISRTKEGMKEKPYTQLAQNLIAKGQHFREIKPTSPLAIKEIQLKRLATDTTLGGDKFNGVIEVREVLKEVEQMQTDFEKIDNLDPRGLTELDTKFEELASKFPPSNIQRPDPMTRDFLVNYLKMRKYDLQNYSNKLKEIIDKYTKLERNEVPAFMLPLLIIFDLKYKSDFEASAAVQNILTEYLAPLIEEVKGPYLREMRAGIEKEISGLKQEYVNLLFGFEEFNFIKPAILAWHASAENFIQSKLLLLSQNVTVRKNAEIMGKYLQRIDRPSGFYISPFFREVDGRSQDALLKIDQELPLDLKINFRRLLLQSKLQIPTFISLVSNVFATRNSDRNRKGDQ